MKKTVIIFLALFSIVVSAQDYKFKKDRVLFDKTPVAKFTDNKSVYTFESLDGSNKIKVELKKINLTSDLMKQWLVISDENSERVSQVEYKILSFSLSLKKILAELLHKEYNILTSNGVENLDAFFEVERPNLEEEYKAQLKQYESDAIANAQAMSEINVTVNVQKKEILSAGEIIGTYVKPSNGAFQNVNIYSLYDLDAHKIAIATLGNFSKVSVTLPYHEKEGVNEIAFKATVNYTITGLNDKDEATFITEVVKNLAINGIALGHQITQSRQANYAAKEEVKKDYLKEFKENSKNVYFTKGYIVSNDDGKKDGEIQFIVEKPENNSGIVDLDEATIGQRVLLKYENKKGKTKFTTFKSKDEEKFCVYTEDGYERCFKGIKVKGKGVELAARSVSSLSFDTSLYYEVIKETSQIGIYKDITYNDGYIVKIEDEDKAIKLKNTTEKDLEKLQDYFQDRIDINEVSNLDFSDIENILKLIDLYKQ
ncbi:MAG: hypothetical protein ACK5MZ_11830 [Aestuariibaculum sp.]